MYAYFLQKVSYVFKEIIVWNTNHRHLKLFAFRQKYDLYALQIVLLSLFLRY